MAELLLPVKFNFQARETLKKGRSKKRIFLRFFVKNSYKTLKIHKIYKRKENKIAFRKRPKKIFSCSAVKFSVF